MSILEERGTEFNLYVYSAVLSWLLDMDLSLTSLADTTDGRVRKVQRTLEKSGFGRKELLTLLHSSGAIQHLPTQETSTAKATQKEVEVLDGIDALLSTAPAVLPEVALAAAARTELAVPASILDGLMAVGVEEDAVASLWFHPSSGLYYRQRIKSKFNTLVFLISVGRIKTATGFFIAAITKNYMLSKSYEPGKKKAPAPTAAEVAQQHVRLSSEAAAHEHHLEVDRERAELAQTGPVTQWEACKGQLQLMLKKPLSAPEWNLLERAAMGGRLLARTVLDEVLKAKASLTFDAYLITLRQQLRELVPLN